MKDLNAAEFKKQIEKDPKAVVIDVRSPEEEAEGNITGARNLNILDASFPEKVKSLDKDKNYYVFCRSGGRSSSACAFMDRQGLTTYNLNGGIQAWNQL
jgi:rhodanese-related sulfurtransferase